MCCYAYLIHGIYDGGGGGGGGFMNLRPKVP